MYKEHQKKQEKLRALIDSKRAVAEHAVEAVVSNTVNQLNEGIATAYCNQHKLDAEAKRLQTNLDKFTKQAQQWMILCQGLNTAVKDLGDISCWSQSIEEDVKFIAEALNNAYGMNNVASSSSSAGPSGPSS